MNMRNNFLGRALRHALFAVIGLGITFQCTKTNEKDEGTDLSEILFIVPEQIKAEPESIIEFRVLNNKAPLQTDDFQLISSNGVSSHSCSIESVSSSKFSVRLVKSISSGEYQVYLKRGQKRKSFGTTVLTLVQSLDFNPDAGTTVGGRVQCDGKGVPDVVVSDGVLVTKTDSEGVYQLKSAKKWGYVFISVPSGYEPLSSGVIPTIHKFMTKPADTVEQLNFDLKKTGSQDNHTLLVFGDMHLANRTKDREQFSAFTKDVNAFVAENRTKGKIYAITLGDMTWDCFWYDNKYGFEEYVKDANAVRNLFFYHTIGNHDHDMAFAGDFNTVEKYIKVIGPTYYSFNIGKVHYIVLDDIECTNTGKGDPDSRHYNSKVVNEQLEWLKKDLEYVPTSTPLVISSHAPLYSDNGIITLGNGILLSNILKDYKKVQLFTGHTHKVYNVDYSDIFEHNSGAVCATWWWSAYETPGVHIAQDGAPGGYQIVSVSGTDFSWQFKATGQTTDYQFRTYDGNQIALTAEKYTPNASADYKAEFEKNAGSWSKDDKSNYVYINVWNYDPAWSITVTENGKSLDVEKISAKDPLHLIAYTAKRLNKGKGASFATSLTKHFFKVKASSDNSTLDIKVIDRFGNEYSERMTRPKPFDVDTYKF